MSEPPVFLSVEQVLGIHRRMIKEFGGRPGLRDQGLLESAVAMPAASFRGRFLHRDIPAMAAACLFHLCRNHPFVDGNKRTALAAAGVFLDLNGLRLAATDAALEKVTLRVADGSLDKEPLTEFFRKHARRR
jgi:death-on-curing protein